MTVDFYNFIQTSAANLYGHRIDNLKWSQNYFIIACVETGKVKNWKINNLIKIYWQEKLLFYDLNMLLCCGKHSLSSKIFNLNACIVLLFSLFLWAICCLLSHHNGYSEKKEEKLIFDKYLFYLESLLFKTIDVQDLNERTTDVMRPFLAFEMWQDTINDLVCILFSASRIKSQEHKENNE